MRSFAIEDPGSPDPPLYATLPQTKKRLPCASLICSVASIWNVQFVFGTRTAILQHWSPRNGVFKSYCFSSSRSEIETFSWSPYWFNSIHSQQLFASNSIFFFSMRCIVVKCHKNANCWHHQPPCFRCAICYKWAWKTWIFSISTAVHRATPIMMLALSVNLLEQSAPNHKKGRKSHCT